MIEQEVGEVREREREKLRYETVREKMRYVEDSDRVEKGERGT